MSSFQRAVIEVIPESDLPSGRVVISEIISPLIRVVGIVDQGHTPDATTPTASQGRIQQRVSSGNDDKAIG
jgi:hypothetical protein